MTGDRDHDQLERELTAGLERMAPVPRADALGRVMQEVGTTPQRRRWVATTAASGEGMWSRALAVGGVGIVALIVGIAIGASGLLPAGGPASPTPRVSAPATAPTLPSPPPSQGPVGAGWTEVVLEPPQDGADVSIVGGLAWRGGAVITGSAYPPAAEGEFPVAWYSTDGGDWARSTITGSPGEPLPRTIGPVVEAADRLVAFGTGQREDGGLSALVYESTDGGASWTTPAQTLPDPAVIADVTSFGRELVAIGASMAEPTTPVVWTSSDGRTWELRPLAGPNGPLTGRFTAIATDGRQLVMLASVTDRAGTTPLPRVMTSIDARTWTLGEIPAAEDAELQDLVFFAQAWHAVGSTADAPASWWSADGHEWREISIDAAGGALGARAIGFGSEGLVAVGGEAGQAVAWRSTSGQRWEAGELVAAGASLRLVLSTESGVLAVGTTVSGIPGQAVAWLRASAAPIEWEEPLAYSFVMESSCGERQLIGRFRVTVADGRVTDVEWMGEGDGPPGITPDVVPTLAQMIEKAREAQASGSSQVELALHPVDGHPTAVSIDWNTQAIDDEECYVISEYLPSSG